MQTMTRTGAEQRELLLLDGYKAFNKRDVGGALNMLHTDVDWASDATGEHLHGHHAVRDYWLQQWTDINPQVMPVRFTHEGDTVSADVLQVVHALDGAVISESIVNHQYTFRDWRVSRMEIHHAGGNVHGHDIGHVGGQASLGAAGTETVIVVQAVVMEIETR